MGVATVPGFDVINQIKPHSEGGWFCGQGVSLGLDVLALFLRFG
jgi:hypothetical protein